MKLINLFPGSYYSNCYVLCDGDSAIVIDPSAKARTILDTVERENAKLKGILLTHGHFDHIIAVDTLRKYSNAPVCIHEEDAEMLTDGNKNANMFFFGDDLVMRPADKTFKDGDVIEFGNISIKVMHTPGHSKGSSCFLPQGTDMIFTGDTIFAEGYGRCDLWGGDFSILRKSIKALTLFARDNPNYTAYSGHGEEAKLVHALKIADYYMD